MKGKKERRCGVCLGVGWILTAFLYQLKAKAIRGTNSLCCTLLVLTAEGGVEEKAGCCYFNCMFTPRLWVWNRAKEKCCSKNSMQLHCVDSLRDRESEITFLCKPTLWIGSKERKREGRGEQHFTLEYQAGVFCQKKGEKALALKHISRYETSGFTNNRGRKGFLWLAEGHRHVGLRQAGSLSHTMDPDDSSTWMGRWHYQSAETPVVSNQRRNGERVGEFHYSEGENQENQSKPKLSTQFESL